MHTSLHRSSLPGLQQYIQLLDLLDALYSKVGHIFSSEGLNRLKNRTDANDGALQDNNDKVDDSGQGGNYCPVVDMIEDGVSQSRGGC